MSTTTKSEKVRENRLRRMAHRQRLALAKTRRRDPHAWDYGTFMIVSEDTNGVVVDDLTLDDVENFLTAWSADEDPWVRINEGRMNQGS